MDLNALYERRKRFSELEQEELKNLINEMEKLEVGGAAASLMAKKMKESLKNLMTMKAIQKIGIEDELWEEFKVLVDSTAKLSTKAKDALKREIARRAYEKASGFGREDTRIGTG